MASVRAGAEFRDEAGVDLVGVEFVAVGGEFRGQRAFSRAYFEEERDPVAVRNGQAGYVVGGGAVGEEVLRERAGNEGGAGHGLRSLSSVKGIRADEGPDRKNVGNARGFGWGGATGFSWGRHPGSVVRLFGEWRSVGAGRAVPRAPKRPSSALVSCEDQVAVPLQALV